MSTAELKNDLHRLIVETNDTDILLKIQDTFTELQAETLPDALSDYEKNMIERGLKDHEEGKVHTNEEVNARFNKWVEKNS